MCSMSRPLSSEEGRSSRSSNNKAEIQASPASQIRDVIGKDRHDFVLVILQAMKISNISRIEAEM